MKLHQKSEKYNEVQFFFLIGLFLLLGLCFAQPSASSKTPQTEGGKQGGENTQRRPEEREITEVLEAHLKWMANPNDALGKRANLENADLRYVDLQGSQLQRAIFTDANLDHANLFMVDLSQALMGNATFKEANLEKANLQRAFLRKGKFQKAKLQHANMQGAALDHTNLSGGNLQHADLTQANLHGAILRQTTLSHTVLFKANLEQADLRGANLQNADLRGANFHQTNVADANLHKTNLTGAKLSGGTDLSAAIGLTQFQIDESCVDENTKLPEGFLHPPPCAG